VVVVEQVLQAQTEVMMRPLFHILLATVDLEVHHLFQVHRLFMLVAAAVVRSILPDQAVLVVAALANRYFSQVQMARSIPAVVEAVMGFLVGQVRFLLQLEPDSMEVLAL
jgi:hypothetical protein